MFCNFYALLLPRRTGLKINFISVRHFLVKLYNLETVMTGTEHGQECRPRIWGEFGHWGQQWMTVMKRHKHSSESVHPARSHGVQRLCVCCFNKGKGCAVMYHHGRVMCAETAALSLGPSFRLDCFQNDSRAGR